MKVRLYGLIIDFEWGIIECVMNLMNAACIDIQVVIVVQLN